MFEDFQLAALVQAGTQQRLLQIPLHQSLQDSLAASWHSQYEALTNDVVEVSFSVGYKPGENECFKIEGYELPNSLSAGSGGHAKDLQPINRDEKLVDSIRAIVAFTRTDSKRELMLAQRFTRSHVIQPGRFLLLDHNTFVAPNGPGLTLDSKLAAAYDIEARKLLFSNFRNTNAFLPLVEFIAEASDQDIREVLGHKLLKPSDIESAVFNANQWSRKRFAMLKASGVLDRYSAEKLVQLSEPYQVELIVDSDRIVFPADRAAQRRMLQFLNEEIFRGAITETLYETNSKRESQS